MAMNIDKSCVSFQIATNGSSKQTGRNARADIGRFRPIMLWDYLAGEVYRRARIRVKRCLWTSISVSVYSKLATIGPFASNDGSTCGLFSISEVDLPHHRYRVLT